MLLPSVVYAGQRHERMLPSQKQPTDFLLGMSVMKAVIIPSISPQLYPYTLACQIKPLSSWGLASFNLLSGDGGAGIGKGRQRTGFLLGMS